MNYFSQKLTLKDSGITWIREIPKHWNVGTLNNLVQIIVSNVDKKSHEAEIKVLLCNYTDVYYNRFINSTIDFMEASATESEVEKFSLEINDVLITKDSETPDDIAVPSLVNEKIPNLVCGYHLSILRPLIDKLDGKYLLFLIISTSIKSQFSSLATGITRYGLSYKHIKSINLCIPPLKEQRSIASFLDRKTAAIDTLIAKKQRLIQLLEEKRTALINQAVTKGLNPNVPMKDSRIPWIGRIPEPWKVKRFKYMISYLEQGWSPSCENRLVTEQEWGVLKVGCVNGSYFNELEHKALPSDLQPKLEYKIKTGDILVSRANTKELLGSAARVHVIKRKLLLCDKLYRLKIVDDVDPAFFVILMKSKCARYQFERDSSGASSSMQNISQESMRDFVLPLASIHEQQLIVDTLNKNFQPLNNLKVKLLKQIEKLQEYRQSLITAAVTGKIDISEEVAV